MRTYGKEQPWQRALSGRGLSTFAGRGRASAASGHSGWPRPHRPLLPSRSPPSCQNPRLLPHPHELWATPHTDGDCGRHMLHCPSWSLFSLAFLTPPWPRPLNTCVGSSSTLRSGRLACARATGMAALCQLLMALPRRKQSQTIPVTALSRWLAPDPAILQPAKL